MSTATTNPSSLGIAAQIPRNSLALLMIAQLVVIVPLATEISPWIVGVCLFCGYWRSQVYQGRWGYPAAWIKVILVIASSLGIAFSGFLTFSLEAATSLLVVAFALKLVEMKSRRDAYVVIYLSYFLIATAFLFDQSMAITAYELFAAVVVTAAMIGMNQLHTRIRPIESLRTAGLLVLQALPLTLVIFLLFPRIAPLWSIPVPSASTTGLSDKLTPGDIANLSRSDELAFRAVFKGKIPQQKDLYWRGLVYSDFKYGTWALAEPLPTTPTAPSSGADIEYEIFLEPTQSKWLYALDTPSALPNRAQMLGDFRLINPEPILSVMRYSVTSNVSALRDLQLSPQIRERETALEPGDNPRIRQYAKDIRSKVDSDEQMVTALLAHIRTEPFVYTLNPDQLGRYDSVDEFWFDTRRGFCTHYAGAVVYALRSVGIPARMVGGYQGGVINPVSQHMVVRQYDAHAWIEVWLTGQGWTHFDPTAAVAPARVESGLNAALSSQERSELSFLSSARQGQQGLLGEALRFIDSAEYRWNLWVVGYDADTQSSVLKDLLGSITPQSVGLALLGGSAASMGLVAAFLFLRGRKQSSNPIERMLQNFSRGIRDPRFARAPNETPLAYINRLAAQANTEAPWAEELQVLLYDPNHPMDWRTKQRLRSNLRRLKFKIALVTWVGKGQSTAST